MKIYQAGERVNINFGASLDIRMQMCAEELKIHTNIVQGTVVYQTGRIVAVSTAFGQINPRIGDVSAVRNKEILPAD